MSNPNSLPSQSNEQTTSAAEYTWDDLANDTKSKSIAEEEAIPGEQPTVVEQSTTEILETPDAILETAETSRDFPKLMDNPLGESEYRPLSEAERRLQVDREGVDAILRMLNNATHENLSPDDKLKVELSLDIFDEVSDQLDDEENDKNVHDILAGMVQKYDNRARKAPTRERSQKYNLMADIASQQERRFTDWIALDQAKNQAKNQPKPDPRNALDPSAIV